MSLTAAPNSNEIDVQRTLATLIAAQVILFVGVGAVIPVVAIYGRETLGLSAAASGVVVSAPALALLLGAKIGGAYADRARKPALVGGMLFIALSDAGTAPRRRWRRWYCAARPRRRTLRLRVGRARLLADLGNIATDLRGRAIAANRAAAARASPGAPLGGSSGPMDREPASRR